MDGGFRVGRLAGAVELGRGHQMYRNEPGPLTDDQHADALVMADIATQALLVLQAEAPPGQLAPRLADTYLNLKARGGL